MFFILFYLFIYLRRKNVHICTHTQKKKKKERNINPKRCTIEKYKFKTQLAKNIGNKTIYTISPMTSMTLIFDCT